MLFKFTPFILLCISGLFAIFSSTISKSPVLPLFTLHLGASPTGVGIIAGVSAFTGIVVSIPSGVFSDKWGRKRMLVLSGIVFSVAPLLYLFATRIWHLALIRFFHGFATAIFIPVAMALVADYFHEERGEKMGWFSASTLCGRFLAPMIGGSILGTLAFNPGLSFRVVYLVCGAAGVIALILILQLPNPNEKEKKEHSRKEILESLRIVISNKIILLTSIVEASILFAYGTFETFLPLHSKSIGLTTYEIGIFLSAQIITLAVTKPVMGKFSDRHGRTPQIFAGAIVGSFCIGCFFLSKSFASFLILSILFGFCLSIVTSATSAFIADLSKQNTRGSAMGTLGSIMDIGHMTGPIFSGIVASSFGISYSFIGAAIVLSVIAFVFLAGVAVKSTPQTM
jgi:DHA1 family multidrug resistance protein-like MFS transporter